LPARLLAGHADVWRRDRATTCRNGPCHFAKNSPPPPTSPPASAAIVDSKKQRLSAMTGHSPHDISCYRKVEFKQFTVSGVNSEVLRNNSILWPSPRGAPWQTGSGAAAAVTPEARRLKSHASVCRRASRGRQRS